MREMGWSFEDLMSTPFERYLDTSRIISLTKKEEQKKQKKTERKVSNQPKHA